MKNVVVIGGGLAGLAAGVYLADAGARVELLERRPFLGGRAYSFQDRETGDTVDNGQHLMMGCYRETFAFLEKIGSLDLVEFQPRSRVDFLDRNGHTVLDCPTLPPPLHLLVGLLNLRGIGFKDKLNTLFVGGSLRTKNGDFERKFGHLTVDEWLSSCRQSPTMKERFWDPLSIATLNESPTVAPASLLVKVLQQGFGGTRRDSCMVTSRVGLSDLYTEQAKTFIESRGGRVRLQTGVSEIHIRDKRFRGATLTTGETLDADACVSAVPYFSLVKLLPAELFSSNPYFAKWRDFRSSPIVAVNVWFDRPVADFSFAGLIGTRVQWAFNKNAILKKVSTDRQHLSLIISAAHEYHRIPKEVLVRTAVEDLRAVLPAARSAKIVRTLVVKEHDATLSSTVEVERARPDFKTPVENLLLAGDWTNTGLPATIEGAVLSGGSCARVIVGG